LELEPAYFSITFFFGRGTSGRGGALSSCATALCFALAGACPAVPGGVRGVWAGGAARGAGAAEATGEGCAGGAKARGALGALLTGG